MYCLREKYSKPITVYIADCFSWVPSLTLLALWTNWTYKHTLGVELIHGWWTYCIFITSNLRSLQDRCCYLPTHTHTHILYFRKRHEGWERLTDSLEITLLRCGRIRIQTQRPGPLHHLGGSKPRRAQYQCRNGLLYLVEGASCK